MALVAVVFVSSIWQRPWSSPLHIEARSPSARPFIVVIKSRLSGLSSIIIFNRLKCVELSWIVVFFFFIFLFSGLTVHLFKFRHFPHTHLDGPPASTRRFYCASLNNLTLVDSVVAKNWGYKKLIKWQFSFFAAVALLFRVLGTERWRLVRMILTPEESRAPQKIKRFARITTERDRKRASEKRRDQ